MSSDVLLEEFEVFIHTVQKNMLTHKLSCYVGVGVDLSFGTLQFVELASA